MRHHCSPGSHTARRCLVRHETRREETSAVQPTTAPIPLTAQRTETGPPQSHATPAVLHIAKRDGDETPPARRAPAVPSRAQRNETPAHCACQPEPAAAFRLSPPNGARMPGHTHSHPPRHRLAHTKRDGHETPPHPLLSRHASPSPTPRNETLMRRRHPVATPPTPPLPHASETLYRRNPGPLHSSRRSHDRSALPTRPPSSPPPARASAAPPRWPSPRRARASSPPT